MMRLPSPPMPFYTPCTTALIDAPTVTRSRQYFAGGLFRGVSRCTGGRDCGTVDARAAHILLIRCRHWYYYVSTTASGHIMLLVRAGRLSMLSRLSGACSSVKNRHGKKTTENFLRLSLTRWENAQLHCQQQAERGLPSLSVHGSG